MSDRKINKLLEAIEDLKKQFPAHSIPPSMVIELEDLEEQLEIEKKKSGGEANHA